MKWLVMILCAALTSCTITVSPLKAKKKYRPKHSQSSKKKKPKKSESDTAKVDQAWMVKYRELEEKYQYWIEEDDEIKPVGSEFLVPKEVINHNLDMIKTKPLP